MTPPSIQPLIQRHLDGTATPEEASQLALALLDDPAAARAFAQATRLEAGLRSCFKAEAVGRRLADTVRFESTQRRGPLRAGWAAAAAMLVMAGLSLAWWRPWARLASPPALANSPAAAPKKRVDAPSPPPSLRHPGTLSAAARAVKQLASRYWLPDAIEFANTPLEEAVSTLQQRATAVNHRQNGTIAQFAIDLPDECASRPVTAARAELPLGAWLELLSAQSGCELRYTETGVAFDPVEQPDALETRRFPLPTIADAQAPAEAPARLFSYARPSDEEPNFRSAPPHGTTLASAWGLALPASTRAVVKDGRTLEIRHTRRELRRLEGLLAVATADAGRPTVTFRAKEVPLPASALVPVVAQLGETPTMDDSIVAMDDSIVDLILVPEVVEFEGFLNYEPVETFGENAEGVRAGITLTESFITQPVFATRSAGSGNRVVGNDEAGKMLEEPPPPPATWAGRYYFGTPLDRVSAPTEITTAVEPLVTLHRNNPTSVPANDGPAAADVTVSFNKLVLAGEEAADWREAPPDPWRTAATATARLGESAGLATNAAAPVVQGSDNSFFGYFRLLDPRSAAPLQATARLEGEMVKLTGSYTPPNGGGAPTDFQAYVGEGQSFILQTEDAPEATMSGVEMVKAKYAPGVPSAEVVDSGLRFGNDSSQWQELLNGRLDHVASAGAPAPRGEGEPMVWNFQDVTGRSSATYDNTLAGPAAASATVRGVVISPVLEWPSPVGQ